MRESENALEMPYKKGLVILEHARAGIIGRRGQSVQFLVVHLVKKHEAVNALELANVSETIE